MLVAVAVYKILTKQDVNEVSILSLVSSPFLYQYIHYLFLYYGTIFNKQILADITNIYSNFNNLLIIVSSMKLMSRLVKYVAKSETRQPFAFFCLISQKIKQTEKLFIKCVYYLVIKVELIDSSMIVGVNGEKWLSEIKILVVLEECLDVLYIICTGTVISAWNNDEQHTLLEADNGGGRKYFVTKFCNSQLLKFEKSFPETNYLIVYENICLKFKNNNQKIILNVFHFKLKKSRQVATALLYIREWGGPRTRIPLALTFGDIFKTFYTDMGMYPKHNYQSSPDVRMELKKTSSIKN
ncbi:hypothetical protein AGLY_004497 [Aphis glycines]|uniref:Uncharacterized protein n=1 Tax=Aphis glycines TaxID=307491 RepID=A0A6G0TY85_APHGL|nr:hypothetical protein AGLY_004497 [Aphis glycines]